jgi:Zn-dependent protease
MREAPGWSVGLGRWLGVPVRLHVSFLLLALATLYIATHAPGRDVWHDALLLLGIWFVSVLLHEAGHAAAISRLGGMADEVVLTPLGGIAEPGFQLEPQREVVVALSGPIVNLAAWVACAALLIAMGEPGTAGLLNPFYPRDLTSGTLLVEGLKIAVWINWVLVLVNLLPACPFDGGRALAAVLSPAIGERRAATVVSRATLTTAAILLVFAVLLPGGSELLVPAWLPLCVLAVYVAFHVEPEDEVSEEEPDEAMFGYDFSQGYTSLEQRIDVPRPSRPGPIRRWLERRRQERETRRRIVERDEEQRVDAILQQLHEQGTQSISAEDQALLNRVAARYRARTQSES